MLELEASRELVHERAQAAQLRLAQGLFGAHHVLRRGRAEQDALPFGVHVHLCYPPTTSTPGLLRENEDKPPEAWAIEGKSRAFPPEAVARAILSGVRRGRFHILVGWDSWFIWFAQRLLPGIVRFVTDRVLLKELRARTPGHALRLPDRS